MEKIDFKKTLKHLYGPSAKNITTVDVPDMNFLMVHGEGAPGCAAFIAAIEALYPVAYTVKFAAKTMLERDFVVMPLEGLWWADDMSDFINDKRDNWQWTLMLMQPDYITPAMVEDAIAQVRVKKNPAALERVQFESFTEGRCAQTLHRGPFSEEGPVIQAIHKVITDDGYALSGKHHEIYLSDMRRVPPEKYRTVLRQPMSS